jgi:hypothetical protein
MCEKGSKHNKRKAGRFALVQEVGGVDIRFLNTELLHSSHCMRLL